ncbi:MAG: thiamine phosphate synthase [Eubacteriales bacterium]
MNWDYSLYLVTDRGFIGSRELSLCVEEAIQGGTTMVQIREKIASSRKFYKEALKIKDICKKYRVPFIVNDRMDIALAVDADGLHLGQDDLPIEIARNYFGKDKIIGISVSSVEEAVLAEKQGANYLGAGAVFPTGTKADANYVSPEKLKKITDAVSIPVVAIGGINASNALQVMAGGIDGISVVSAILGRADILQASRELRSLLDTYNCK